MSERPGQLGITTAALDGLVSRLKGEVFTPDDAGYERETAGFNRLAEHRPDVIVAAGATADVCAAVSFASEQGLPVAVQATGHGTAAPARGGVLVSTRRMNTVVVEPLTRTAYAEAGAQWHQVISAAAVHGLAPLNGSSPLVGVVGYTLGGGLGPLGRQFGYAADHVTRIELVTADGDVRMVSRDEHPDLFWALRGGKGNFGIVTGIWFSLMPVRRLYGGGLYFPGEQAVQVLDTWRRWSATVPEEMTSSVALLRLPDVPDVPRFLRGRVAAHVRIAYTGPAEEGERLVGPLRECGTAMEDSVGEMPYTAVADIHQDPTHPLPYHERNIVLRELDSEALATLLRVAGPGSDCGDLMVELRQLGGALGRPAGVPNAVGVREGAYTLSTLSPPGSADTVLGPMEPWGTGRRYLNFLAGSDTADATAECFDTETLTRLSRIKAAYDPGNIFRLNHNIVPVP
ncbi:FAD-binding oxidoreductase [Streptomyces atroolivaceus]|uniref:FAD-binding oxidoreductase n=1 Tax=Streptomyces atroolivaceus TaxID=66869 RepID=A0ABV9VEI9_STRAZ|nr:FAD-binding oxidoreductase [Streptomyces atroolivaceus]